MPKFVTNLTKLPSTKLENRRKKGRVKSLFCIEESKRLELKKKHTHKASIKNKIETRKVCFSSLNFCPDLKRMTLKWPSLDK